MNPYELTARRNLLQAVIRKVTREKRRIELEITAGLIDRKEYDLLRPDYSLLNRRIKHDETIQTEARQDMENSILSWLTT